MNNRIYLLNSVTNIQMDSYVITTADGKVIVVDGGHRQDAPNMLDHLRRITGQEIPHVDAWFLTHAHSDHINCLVELVESHWDQIDVEKIYYNFPSAQYCLREGPWGMDEIGAFLKILPAIVEKTVIVYGNDVYDIGDAHVEILYSPNCEINCNHINNSSVVFRMTVNGKRILFLGDAGVDEGRYVQRYYKGTDKLKADIVQMAHHGQGGVDKEFHAEVAPSVCMWGAPDWLWNNDAGKGYNTHIFGTIIVQGWMKELGVEKHYVLMNGSQEIEL